MKLVEEETAGDPMSESKWLRSSLRHLSEKLRHLGHSVSHETIRRLLHKKKYSLKVNHKEKESRSQPLERNAQFEYIASQKQIHLSEKHPVISVDTKKKELIGDFKNAGVSWRREPQRVNVHDFRSEAEGIAVPYGIYELNRNKGYVCVGQSADTGEFAVDAIAKWWESQGRASYPEAQELVILSDSGGSNGCRPRLWKQQLQKRLADDFGLKVTVHHYPTGCSKWNPIEHRLFSQISVNWSGKPLSSFDVMLGYIRGTQTTTGLQVDSTRIEKTYQKGLKISESEMKGLNIEFHTTCPRWNYTIQPRFTGEKGEVNS